MIVSCNRSSDVGRIEENGGERVSFLPQSFIPCRDCGTAPWGERLYADPPHGGASVTEPPVSEERLYAEPLKFVGLRPGLYWGSSAPEAISCTYEPPSLLMFLLPFAASRGRPYMKSRLPHYIICYQPAGLVEYECRTGLSTPHAIH